MSQPLYYQKPKYATPVQKPKYATPVELKSFTLSLCCRSCGQSNSAQQWRKGLQAALPQTGARTWMKLPLVSPLHHRSCRLRE